MVRVSALTASDADREVTEEQRRHAIAEGRMTPLEREARLGALYRSTSYGDLDALEDAAPLAQASRRSGTTSATSGPPRPLVRPTLHDPVDRRSRPH